MIFGSTPWWKKSVLKSSKTFKKNILFLFFTNNCEFGSNLKIDLFWPKINTFSLIVIAMRQWVNKHCGLQLLKGDTFTKKMRVTRSVLINLQGFSITLKITKIPYFITLSPAFLGLYSRVAFTILNMPWHKAPDSILASF